MSGPGRAASSLLDYRVFFLFLRRRARLIGAITLATLALTALAIAIVPPRYTAAAVVLVDPRQQRVLPTEAVLAGIGNDTAAVESQVEVLDSRVLALRVISSLGLDRDPEFVGPSPLRAFIDPVRRALGLAIPEDSPARALERARAHLQDNLKVHRRGLTYVLELSFTAQDPEKAARVANAVADAYLSDQIGAKLEATTRAASWLDERAGDLRERVGQAERAVADYKAAHNIVDTAEGKTLADRQIAELSQQLILARARTAEARSRLDQATKATGRAGTLGAIPEALQSPLIANLRSQYAQVARSEAEAASTYGERHPAIAQIRSQLGDIRRQIETEVARVAAGLRNEFEAAQSRERSLDASVAVLKQQVAENDQATVRLRELERDALATRTVLSQFLLRSRETGEQENLQRADARILSAASAPLRPSFPRPTLMMALALIGGLGLGVGAAALAEAARRGYRTPREIEESLSVPALGILPLVGERDLRLPHERRGLRRSRPSSERGEDAPLTRDERLRRFGVDRQITPFGEGLRAIRTRLIGELVREPGPKVVLVCSALPDEGKSTVAANLAHSLARTGLATLLIDVDVRRPTIAAPRVANTPGLLQILREDAAPENVIASERASGLSVLTAGAIESVADASELLGGKAMAGLLERLRSTFEVIILDGPPLLPFADGRQLLALADAAVLVVAWAATDRDSVLAAVDSLGPGADKIAGAVLNKVDLDAFRLYDTGYAYRHPSAA